MVQVPLKLSLSSVEGHTPKGGGGGGGTRGLGGINQTPQAMLQQQREQQTSAMASVQQQMANMQQQYMQRQQMQKQQLQQQQLQQMQWPANIADQQAQEAPPLPTTLTPIPPPLPEGRPSVGQGLMAESAASLAFSTTDGGSVVSVETGYGVATAAEGCGW